MCTDNDHFMIEAQGLSGFDSISGFIALTVRPVPLWLYRPQATEMRGFTTGSARCDSPPQQLFAHEKEK